MNWRDHITVDAEICHSKACISGTCVLVTTVLDNLAAGLDADEIVRSYLSASYEAVRATLCYAATLANERVVLSSHKKPAWDSSLTRIFRLISRTCFA